MASKFLCRYPISLTTNVRFVQRAPESTLVKFAVLPKLPLPVSYGVKNKVRHLSTSLYQFNKIDSENKIEDSHDNNAAECIGEGSWEEIYQGILSAQIKLLKTFSLGTSIIGVMCQPLLYVKLGISNPIGFLGLASFIGFFTFVTPCMIHWVSKKYVTKLEYDAYRDIYAATTISFMLKEHKIEFNPKDVIRPDIPGMFTSFKVHGKSLFIDPEMFDNIDHYARIMGYDKPLNLRIDDSDKKGKES